MADAEVLNEFRRALVESLFCACVRDGDIEIANRPAHDIIADFDSILESMIKDPEFSGKELHPVFDHGDKLLTRAESELATGDPLIAILFYVIWLEHYANGTLAWAFERQGHHRDAYFPIIRQLNIETKLTATWKLLGLPEIPKEKLSLAKQAIELRNGFVHYKWTTLTHQEADRQKSRERRIAAEMPTLVSHMQGIENELLWAGREEEVINAFRMDAARRESIPEDAD
ncbi:hypothetical protein OG271_13690 [Micromonospora rifamycinica]|uniref:hypothetical protein n=1 Tax=Micromonospora rifamycinica TaxID=291594 RepID=UPI002E2BFF2F|nr:hypothetical protein [Micromonospora rifamycinica]